MTRYSLKYLIQGFVTVLQFYLFSFTHIIPKQDILINTYQKQNILKVFTSI